MTGTDHYNPLQRRFIWYYKNILKLPDIEIVAALKQRWPAGLKNRGVPWRPENIKYVMQGKKHACLLKQPILPIEWETLPSTAGEIHPQMGNANMQQLSAEMRMAPNGTHSAMTRQYNPSIAQHNSLSNGMTGNQMGVPNSNMNTHAGVYNPTAQNSNFFQQLQGHNQFSHGNNSDLNAILGDRLGLDTRDGFSDVGNPFGLAPMSRSSSMGQMSQQVHRQYNHMPNNWIFTQGPGQVQPMNQYHSKQQMSSYPQNLQQFSHSQYQQQHSQPQNPQQVSNFPNPQQFPQFNNPQELARNIYQQRKITPPAQTRGQLLTPSSPQNSHSSRERYAAHYQQSPGPRQNRGQLGRMSEAPQAPRSPSSPTTRFATPYTGPKPQSPEQPAQMNQLQGGVRMVAGDPVMNGGQIIGGMGMGQSHHFQGQQGQNRPQPQQGYTSAGSNAPNVMPQQTRGASMERPPIPKHPMIRSLFFRATSDLGFPLRASGNMPKEQLVPVIQRYKEYIWGVHEWPHEIPAEDVPDRLPGFRQALQASRMVQQGRPIHQSSQQVQQGRSLGQQAHPMETPQQTHRPMAFPVPPLSEVNGQAPRQVPTFDPNLNLLNPLPNLSTSTTSSSAAPTNAYQYSQRSGNAAGKRSAEDEAGQQSPKRARVPDGSNATPDVSVQQTNNTTAAQYANTSALPSSTAGQASNKELARGLQPTTTSFSGQEARGALSIQEPQTYGEYPPQPQLQTGQTLNSEAGVQAAPISTGNSVVEMTNSQGLDPEGLDQQAQSLSQVQISPLQTTTPGNGSKQIIDVSAVLSRTGSGSGVASVGPGSETSLASNLHSLDEASASEPSARKDGGEGDGSIEVEVAKPVENSSEVAPEDKLRKSSEALSPKSKGPPTGPRVQALEQATKSKAFSMFVTENQCAPNCACMDCASYSPFNEAWNEATKEKLETVKEKQVEETEWQQDLENIPQCSWDDIMVEIEDI